MADNFDAAVDHAMIYEVGGFWNLDAPGVQDGTNKRGCGYTVDPTDPGGETKFGVSKVMNPNVDVTNLDWDGAKDVYYKKYWLAGKCDKLSGRIAALHFDGGINNGIGQAAKFLQRAVNVDDDGQIGPGTLAAVAALDETDVCNAICDQRADFYKKIVERKPEQGKYLKGWLRRIEEMRTYVTDPEQEF